MRLNRCPGCTNNKTGTWTYIYTCAKCGKKYCYLCKNSDTARRCPDCGSNEQKSERDEAYFS